MSLPIILLIMVLTGILGGMLNRALQTNAAGVVTTAQPLGKCILIGIGATILIPLFLEIAQSKLLDHMHNSWSMSRLSALDSLDTKPDVAVKPDKKEKQPVAKADTVKNGTKDTAGNSKRKVDSLLLEAKKAKATEAKAGAKAAEKAPSKKEEEQSGPKNYLLYAAYCLLAAAAGPRFINGLLDGVLKDKQIATLAKEKKVVTAEKDEAVEAKEKVVEEKKEIEKQKAKLAAQNRLTAKKEQQSTIIKLAEGAVESATDGRLETAEASDSVDQLKAFNPGPIIHRNDPQKGRFGGKSEQNGRVLRAKVGPENADGFFPVTIWVESLNAAEPLQDVRFFLHDSLRPSVYFIRKHEFKGKKAQDQFLAYGAFTVGAVTDNGKTLLELDLAEQAEFPEEFRER